MRIKRTTEAFSKMHKHPASKTMVTCDEKQGWRWWIFQGSLNIETGASPIVWGRSHLLPQLFAWVNNRTIHTANKKSHLVIVPWQRMKYPLWPS